MHDLSEYIGIPFKYGGRTKQNLDCYGLVMLLYKELHNIELPDVVSPEYLETIAELVSTELVKWQPCELKEGALLVFSIRGYGAHVGYYLGGDKMIHTWEKTNGVTIERLSHSWQHRLLGTYEYVEKKNKKDS